MRYCIPEEYSDITGLRYCSVSDFSGEDFYHKVLNTKFYEAYSQKEPLELILDGSQDGFGPSFLDESIGNLVYDFSLAIVEKLLKVISNTDGQWLKMIEEKTYPKWEQRRLDKKQAMVTELHPAWYRLIDGNIETDVWVKPE